MRIALNLLGALLTLSGAIWFLQGIGVLPGSFMTGQIQWAVYGGTAMLVGVFMLITARRAGVKPGGSAPTGSKSRGRRR